MSTTQNLSALALTIGNILKSAPECHVGHETIRACWALGLTRDLEWRRESIASFALEHGWEVEQSFSSIRFSVPRLNGKVAEFSEPIGGIDE